MQWLKLVSEDGGVQRLKANNRLPVRTPGVDPVPPYPATHSARIDTARQSHARPVKDRRQSDRRKGGERRKKQVAVVLDTRSKHDRRALEDRRGSKKRSHDKRRARSHINIYV
jgi:hypothetical protein